MVMEFVNGKTLGELIPPRGLNTSSALHYAVQIADGLRAFANIVHRDLKPGNIMVTPHELVKILDFGLAKLTPPTGPVSLSDETMTAGPAPMTVKGSIVGTVCYMSPEQAQGTKVDARSDISPSAVYCTTMTRRKAFSGASPLLTLTGILRDEPTPVEELAPGTPPELVALIHRAMRKEPSQRFQSMQEMHADLLALKQRSDSGVLTVQTIPAPKPKARAVGGLSIFVLAMAVLAVVFGGVWWWTGHRAAKPAAASNATASNPNAPPKPSALSPTVLNNQAILDMVDAHVPVSVIIDHIQSSKTSFNLSTSEIIRLTKGGVTEPIIQAMRNPGNAAAAAAAANQRQRAALRPRSRRRAERCRLSAAHRSRFS